MNAVAILKFQIGQRVSLNRRAAHSRNVLVNAPDETRIGTVKGFSRDGKYVNVLRDGQKTVMQYHPDFWDLVASPVTPETKE